MNPFDNKYFIGYVNHVSPQYTKVHFPSSTLLSKYVLGGEEYYGGILGNFITIEGDNKGFIGEIVELDLPEKERLSLSEKAFQSSDFHPTAKVGILLSFDYYDSKNAQKTLNDFPNIGAKVYICPSGFIQQYVMQFGRKDDKLLINFGYLTSNQQTSVRISQQALFSRHCAVVGTTGGGKSWTVAKLIEGMISNATKSILIDPTGEYADLANQKSEKSVSMGKTAYFSYKDLTVEDLFFLVKPAERIQAPKLIEAIRSLKCIENGIGNNSIFSGNCINGNLRKTGLNKREFDRYCYQNVGIIENGSLNFNIERLEAQITCECVYDEDRSNHDIFGGKNDNDLSNCVSLITRIANVRRTGIFKSLFGFGDMSDDIKNLKEIIREFLDPDQKKQVFLRIGFEDIGFESQAREIAANAIGKNLLDRAREGFFATAPVVLFLDEAHQFLNKSVVDQYFNTASLSAYDNIAKECRKYGLFLCLATQMPKDIPTGTLSQMGTFIVHRLINYNDKEAIKQACSTASSEILTFLPALGAGEAILTGVEFPMSLNIKVSPPNIPPNSKTPIFRSSS
jgi:hypothetical protein